MKLLSAKTSELTKRERAHIKDLMEKGKMEEARIRVEHVIKDDDLVQAYGILSLFCEKLLARLDIIEISPYVLFVYLFRLY
jgi:vacuolar protein sorting-associated protein IST1